MARFQINMNGTSSEELINQRMLVLEEVAELENALRKATPHARDYFDPYAYSMDWESHAIMMAHLDAIKVWATQGAERVMEQGG